MTNPKDNPLAEIRAAYRALANDPPNSLTTMRALTALGNAVEEIQTLQKELALRGAAEPTPQQNCPARPAGEHLGREAAATAPNEGAIPSGAAEPTDAPDCPEPCYTIDKPLPVAHSKSQQRRFAAQGVVTEGPHCPTCECGISVKSTAPPDEDCYIHGPGTFPQSEGCRCAKCAAVRT